MAHDIDEVAMAAHANALSKGFWDKHEGPTDVTSYLARLALIHSEVSEVIEAVRKDKGGDAVTEELADVIIRVFDLWGGMVRDGYTNERISDAIFDKMEKNADRPRMHGHLA